MPLFTYHGEAIEFWISEKIKSTMRKKLCTAIVEEGGDVVPEIPEVGYALVAPGTDEGAEEAQELAEILPSDGDDKKTLLVCYTFVFASLHARRLLGLKEMKKVIPVFVVNGRSMRFFLHSSVEEEERLILQITLWGGVACDDVADADVVIVDDPPVARKLSARLNRKIIIEPPTWVKSCILRRHVYRDDQHGVRKPQGRPVGSVRTEFTEEDDKNLIKYLGTLIPSQNGGRTSLRLFEELHDDDSLAWAKRHPAQAWQNRYKKNREIFDRNIARWVARHPEVIGRVAEKRAKQARERRWKAEMLDDEESEDEELEAPGKKVVDEPDKAGSDGPEWGIREGDANNNLHLRAPSQQKKMVRRDRPAPSSPANVPPARASPTNASAPSDGEESDTHNQRAQASTSGSRGNFPTATQSSSQSRGAKRPRPNNAEVEIPSKKRATETLKASQASQQKAVPSRSQPSANARISHEPEEPQGQGEEEEEEAEGDLIVVPRPRTNKTAGARGTEAQEDDDQAMDEDEPAASTSSKPAPKVLVPSTSQAQGSIEASSSQAAPQPAPPQKAPTTRTAAVQKARAALALSAGLSAAVDMLPEAETQGVTDSQQLNAAAEVLKKAHEVTGRRSARRKPPSVTDTSSPVRAVRSTRAKTMVPAASVPNPTHQTRSQSRTPSVEPPSLTLTSKGRKGKDKGKQVDRMSALSEEDDDVVEGALTVNAGDQSL